MGLTIINLFKCLVFRAGYALHDTVPLDLIIYEVFSNYKMRTYSIGSRLGFLSPRQGTVPNVSILEEQPFQNREINVLRSSFRHRSFYIFQRIILN